MKSWSSKAVGNLYAGAQVVDGWCRSVGRPFNLKLWLEVIHHVFRSPYISWNGCEIHAYTFCNSACCRNCHLQYCKLQHITRTNAYRRCYWFLCWHSVYNFMYLVLLIEMTITVWRLWYVSLAGNGQHNPGDSPFQLAATTPCKSFWDNRPAGQLKHALNQRRN